VSSFVCPRCGTSSAHPKDAEHGYCGRCHAFTGTPAALSTPEDLPDPYGALMAAAQLDDPQAAAQRVLHHAVEATDPAGVEAGSFVQALIRAFVCADRGNRSRLHQAFPAYGFVFLVLDMPDGVELVRRLARGESLEVPS
jgi:uncharacterized OB-fold protein